MRKLRLIRFPFLFIAGIINAVGITLFLAPLKLFDSGISGTAFLLDIITPPYFILSMFLILLNFPFYIIAWRKIGFDFLIYSLFAISVYAGAAFLFRNVLPIDFSQGSPITGGDILLSALFGGLLSGIGSGLVIRMGGAIDGVEVLSVLFAKKLGLTVGSFMMIYNVILYSISALIFHSWKIPLYSIIAYAIGINTIDFVVEGLDRAKAIFIITDADSAIPDRLSDELGLGVTLLDAHGVYSNEGKQLIYCVVTRFEIHKVKQIVADEAPNAFITISEISETVGGTVTKFSPFRN